MIKMKNNFSSNKKNENVSGYSAGKVKRDYPKKTSVSDRQKTEEKPDDSIVFGRNSVSEVLRSGRTVDKVLVLRGEREGSVVRIIATAKEKGIPVVEADKQKLDSITKSGNHQGVVAFTTEYTYCEPEDIISYALEKGEKPFILVIDGINDPMNLGAIIRSAEICGVHGIILPKRNTCGLTSAVFKAAAGACEYMKVARVVNITAAIDLLKENNIWVFGTDGAAEGYIYDSDFKCPCALVLGSEGKGISQLVAKHCDYLVKIPMSGNITSFNISAAGAICMYEVVRQRTGGING